MLTYYYSTLALETLAAHRPRLYVLIKNMVKKLHRLRLAVWLTMNPYVNVHVVLHVHLCFILMPDTCTFKNAKSLKLLESFDISFSQKVSTCSLISLKQTSICIILSKIFLFIIIRCTHVYDANVLTTLECTA